LGICSEFESKNPQTTRVRGFIFGGPKGS